METEFKRKYIDKQAETVPEKRKKNLFKEILDMEKPIAADKPAPGDLSVAIFAGFDAEGSPLVTTALSENKAPVPARSTVSLKELDNGREVTLIFESGDYKKPVITGIIKTVEEITAPDIHIDGERLVLEGEREIVLRCGKASITLTRAGKVLIRGAYVLNRSSGVNRIKGGSVQIN